MSFALAFRVSSADGTFQDLVSHLAFLPAEVEILGKTLGIEDGKGPVGTTTALDTPAFEDLVSVVKFGTETCTLAQSGRLWTTVRRLSVSQRTCARACISSRHGCCLTPAVAQEVAEAVREVEASAP